MQPVCELRPAVAILIFKSPGAQRMSRERKAPLHSAQIVTLNQTEAQHGAPTEKVGGGNFSIIWIWRKTI
jgi:hypothetical protein